MGFSRQEYWSGVPLPSPTFVPRRNQYSFSLLSLPFPSLLFSSLQSTVYCVRLCLFHFFLNFIKAARKHCSYLAFIRQFLVLNSLGLISNEAWLYYLSILINCLLALHNQLDRLQSIVIIPTSFSSGFSVLIWTNIPLRQKWIFLGSVIVWFSMESHILKVIKKKKKKSRWQIVLCWV